MKTITKEDSKGGKENDSKGVMRTITTLVMKMKTKGK